jgi:hypothetical protein
VLNQTNLFKTKDGRKHSNLKPPLSSKRTIQRTLQDPKRICLMFADG